MTQGLLFGLIERDADPGPPPPHNGTETSREAAASIREHASRLLALVVATIRDAGNGGMTCDEVEVETGLSHQTASARVNQAAKAGLIVEARDAAGEVVKRPTRSGRRAVAWIASESAAARGAAEEGD